MDKPLLIFDGDCGFCRMWIARWKRLTGDKIEYSTFQELNRSSLPPAIPSSSDFAKAVHLLEPEGRVSRGAEAVFRTLGYAGFNGWLWAYEKLPGFAPITEFFYSVVAGHRSTFSSLTRRLWGDSVEPSSYRYVRWLFLRAMALIYGIAFWSFAVQIKGLIGSQGIFPAREFLRQLIPYGVMRFWYVPTLVWLNSSDAFLLGMCIAGIIFSFLLLLNIAPRFSLAAQWLLYLSLVCIGGDFMNFQWDALLLETGFLAIFFAPSGFFPQFRGSRSPAPPLVFLLRWLLFRLMLQSALVKWFSGDPLWRHFTALTVHYQTQPLPGPLSWYVHQWPVWFHKISCLLMFVIEGFVPFLIFTPRRSRFIAFWAFVLLQTLIFLTGNYTYFNLLAMALCLLLLDDACLRKWLPAWCEEPIGEETGHSSRRFCRLMMVTILFLTSIPFAQVLRFQLPRWFVAPSVWVSPLRSFNSFGLFAVMTPDRPEIILEGSNDGKIWQAYEFKCKPGDLFRRPRQVAPYQPRLDWQMWFAALSDYRQNAWFLNFCVRILQGSKPVLALLAKNPFPDAPPSQLRATVYVYRFSTTDERRQTGAWWVRENKGLYCPVLSLNGSKN